MYILYPRYPRILKFYPMLTSYQDENTVRGHSQDDSGALEHLPRPSVHSLARPLCLLDAKNRSNLHKY